MCVCVSKANFGVKFQTEDQLTGDSLSKILSPIGKKLIFGSVVKLRMRVRFRAGQLVVMVRASPQEVNASLCNVPKK